METRFHFNVGMQLHRCPDHLDFVRAERVTGGVVSLHSQSSCLEGSFCFVA